MPSARGHCRGGECIASPPAIPVARDAHDLSDASKPPLRKLRWQFDPQVRIRGAQFHGSKKNPSTWLWFFICFSVIFFGLGHSFCFHSLLCDISSMSSSWIHNSSPVMTLSKNSSLSYEVFQSAQHSFRRNFWSGVSSFGTILVQTFFISKCSVNIVWRDDFPKPSSSVIILTVNWRSLSTRECARSMFSLPLEVEGRPDLASSLGSSRPSWKQFFPLGHTLHKHVAASDEFLGHSSPVPQDNCC